MVPWPVAIILAVACAAACSEVPVAGAGGKKSAGGAGGGGGGEELGNEAPGGAQQMSGDSEKSGQTTGTATGQESFNDGPVDLPASISGAFLICPMVETSAQGDLTAQQDMFGCVATPDGKEISDLGAYRQEWHVYSLLGIEVPAKLMAAPKDALIQQLFVVPKSVVTKSLRAELWIFQAGRTARLAAIKGKVLVDKRVPYPQAGDALNAGPCGVCATDTGTSTGN